MLTDKILNKLVKDLTEHEKGLLSLDWKSAPIPDGITFQELIDRCAQKNPGSYGSKIAKAVLFLTREYVDKTSPKMDMGDGLVDFKDVLEIKTSFESIRGNKRSYRIAHVRLYQDIKMYLLVFIDRETLTARFYLLPTSAIKLLKLTATNGTAAANRENKNYSLSTTVKSEDVKDLIGSYSVLRGTTFEDYLYYLQYYTKRNNPKSRTKGYVENLAKIRKLGMTNLVYLKKQKVTRKL